ncbi:PadR family transcriptional regulator, partial [Micromonospora musae]
ANDYHTEALAQVREQVKSARKEGEDYDASALEFAVAYHRAALSWLKSAPVG